MQSRRYVGLPPKPAWGHCPQTPSSLRGGFKQLGWNQVSLRFLILAFLRFAIDETGGYDGVVTPNPAWGHCLQTSSSLRGGFNKGLRMGFREQKRLFRIEPVSIAECFAFCAETTFFLIGDILGYRPDLFGALPQTPLRGIPPQAPFSASRWF